MSTSETQYDRWCVVPATTEPLGEDGDLTIPTFHNKSGIDGWSGTIIPRSSLDDFYAGWLANHPNTDEFYVVRFYATGDSGYAALNEMAVTFDCLVMSEQSHNIADVLNTRIPGESRTGDQWAQSFRIS